MKSIFRLTLMLIAAGFVTCLVSRALSQSSSSAVQRRLDYLVTFEITQGTEKSEDQLTIIFSDRQMGRPATAPAPVRATAAPSPVFGEDIIQEFSFSSRDFTSDKLRFTRRVKDRSFMEARFIRVVNHGADPWGGRSIAVWIDGEPVLPTTPIASYQDPENTGRGIQNYNRGAWDKRVFWEIPLPQRRSAKD